MTFTYTVSGADWIRILPELVLIGITLLLMLVDLVLPHSGPRSKDTGPANFVILPILALLGIAGTFAATITLFIRGDQQTAFYDMVGSDQGTLYAYLIILTASTLGVLFSPAYLKRLNLVHQGEYYALLLLSTIGMMFMAAATNFMTIFIGIETLSLALYILCSFIARRKGSQESGMKYFLLSSFASAFLLYGISLTYGATGTTAFVGVRNFLTASNGGTHSPTLLLIGMGLMIVGFTFKISAIPFQAWTPDVYQGAPAPITAFMSVGTKVAALVSFVRVFGFALSPVQNEWMTVVWAITIVTIVGGNILALVQTNVKRLLAYSSVAHGGYLLIGVVAAGTKGAEALGAGAILFYLFCYAFMNLGAFGVISMLEHLDNSGSSTQDLRGLWYRRPVLAGSLAFFLFALAGFPPMSGFAGKYYLFYTALVSDHPELLLIGVLASILGIYYYLRVIATMFMEREPAQVVEDVVAPISTTGRHVTARSTGGLSSGGTATAIATRPVAQTRSTTSTTVATQVEPLEVPAGRLAWFSWCGLALAILGTLAMGTVLPFWLVNLANQAAGTLLK